MHRRKASEEFYEVMFTPNLEAAGQFALQDGHIVRRTFNGDDTALDEHIFLSLV